jgi:hypothetical protein
LLRLAAETGEATGESACTNGKITIFRVSNRRNKNDYILQNGDATALGS